MFLTMGDHIPLFMFPFPDYLSWLYDVFGLETGCKAFRRLLLQGALGIREYAPAGCKRAKP